MPESAGFYWLKLAFLLVVIMKPVYSYAEVIPLKIGVLAIKGGDTALRNWSPLAQYLNNKLPQYRFQILPLDLSETGDAVESKRVDLILTNPSDFVVLQEQHGITAIATLKKMYQGKNIDSFGAVIFTRADNKKINSLEELKGKTFMGVKPNAFGGFQMAWRELKKYNIDPFTEIRELQFSGFPQPAVVMAVKNGLVDAGTVRTGILELLASKGAINLHDFKIINERHIVGFPFLLSTEIYPEWSFAYLSHVNNGVAGEIFQVLTNMPANILQFGSVKITGWSSPNNYQAVRDLMKSLQVGPYKNLQTLLSPLFLKKYRSWLIFSLVVIILMAVFTGYVVFLNRRMLSAQRDLEIKIQESLKLEQSLQQEKIFLGATLNNITDGVIACDNASRITLLNDGASNILGLDFSDVKGQLWQSCIDFYQADGVSLVKGEDSPFNQVLRDSQLRNYEVIFKDDSGSKNLVINGQEIINTDGERTGVVLSLHDITERLSNDRRLRASEKDLRAILDNMQDTYYRTDMNGGLISISRSVREMFGYNLEETLGVNLRDLYVDAEGRADFIEALNEGGGSVQNYQTRMYRKSRKIMWVSTSAHFHYDGDGDIDGVEGVTRDITELKTAEALLFQEKERAQITLQSIGDGVITIDVAGNILYINPYAKQMIGCTDESIDTQPLKSYLYFLDATTQVLLDDPVEKCLKKEDVLIFAEHIHAVRKDGTSFSVKLTVSPMRDVDGVIKGVVMVMHDVSEMWKLTQQLSYQATHDALTGLINRREFDYRLEAALKDSKKTGNQHALCYMDLDQFKVVNDTCGHIAGDRLLKQLVVVLKQDMRKNDVFARLGGDEFGLLLSGCSLDKAGEIAEEIRKTVKAFRFTWEEKNFEIGVSIGIVPVTRDIVSITELLSEADAACYVAKDLGRNRVHKYKSGDTELVKHKNEMQWVNRIQQALNDERFVIYCQSIQPVFCENKYYLEILVRMLDEKGDIVLPGAFIPAAERYYLMSDIDRWVIRRVFSYIQNSSEQNNYYTINLSGQSVGDNAMLNYIIEGFKEYQIEPSIICFEITETAAMANLDSAKVFIDRLHDLGCQFALDDFGSGLSSFAYLKNLDVDFLKIDGSFVRDIAHDPVDYAMVASINKIGHLMGIKTIAEFVEDKDILERLKDIGVDYVQGYHIDIPLPLSDKLDKQSVNL